jgi:hypothetical protein
VVERRHVIRRAPRRVSKAAGQEDPMRRFDLSIPLAAIAAFGVFAAAAAGVMFTPVRWVQPDAVGLFPGVFAMFGAPTLALGFGLVWLALLFAWSVARTRRRPAVS